MPPNQFWYCAMLALMLYSSFMCTSYLLTAMTFERFYSIIQPHKAASFNTVKRAKIIIAGIFIFGFSYSIPFLFTCDNNGRLCIPNAIASHNVLGELYYWLTEILISIVRFLSLLSMNCVIIHTLSSRSNLNILGSGSHGESECHNLKGKHPENRSLQCFYL